jgi:hypothetical protein
MQQAAKEEARNAAVLLDIRRLIEDASAARGCGDWKRALDLINVARVTDAKLAKAVGADELQDEVKREQGAAEEAKQQEELENQARAEEQERRAREERAERERKAKAFSMLDDARRILTSSSFQKQGSIVELKALILTKRGQCDVAALKVLEAEKLLPGDSAQLKEILAVMQEEQASVAAAEALVARREVEEEGERVMAEYAEHAATAEGIRAQAAASDDILLQDLESLAAKALDDTALQAVNLEAAEERAAAVKLHWEDSAALNVQLRRSAAAASKALATVSSLPEPSVACRAATPAVSGSMKQLLEASSASERMLVQVKTQYEAAVAALVRERARREAAAEALLLAKRDRYKKRKQRPLQPCNEHAMQGWGVGAWPAAAAACASTLASSANLRSSMTLQPERERERESGSADGQQLKRHKEDIAAAPPPTPEGGGGGLVHETVRRIVMEWKARRWSGDRVEEASAALRQAGARGVQGVSLLETVSGTLAAHLQISVVVSIPVSPSQATRSHTHSRTLSDSPAPALSCIPALSPEQDVGGVVASALARYLEVPREALTMLSLVCAESSTGSSSGGSSSCSSKSLSVVMLLAASSADVVARAAVALGSTCSPAVADALGCGCVAGVAGVGGVGGVGGRGARIGLRGPGNAATAARTGLQVCGRMLTYADVCWRMLTQRELGCRQHELGCRKQCA